MDHPPPSPPHTQKAHYDLCFQLTEQLTGLCTLSILHAG